jgi:CheY-like chemotaxis protein
MTGLLMDTGLTPEQRQFAEVIRQSGDSLLTIINDILDFSKIEAGRLELERQPFDLGECVESALELVAARASEKGIALTCLVDPGTPPWVVGDVTRLRQVLLNLLNNAVKFTEAGEVVVSVAAEPVEGPGRYRFSFIVRDTGIGIPADRMGGLFESFTQVDASTTRRFGGTGLGLAISKRLVELMGGHIEVDSTPGEGSTFRFTIIAPTSASPPRPRQHAAPPELARTLPLRILLAEDNAVNQQLALLLLSKLGYRADVASNGLEVLAALERQPYDVVLMDVQMPEMDGLEATRRITSRWPGGARPRIIAVTANAMQGDRQLCESVGMDDYVTKPIRIEELAQALRRSAAVAVPDGPGP